MASCWRRLWSSPRAGGAASKGPTTPKRKVAHRSGEGTFEESVDIAVCIFSPVLWRCRGSTPASMSYESGILCGRINRPQLAGIGAAEEVVIGARKRSRSSNRSRRSAAKISHNDHGRVAGLSAGMKRARASFQNALWGKAFSQKSRHRFKVRASAPVILRRWRTRFALSPWHMAARSTTMKPA